MPKLFNQPLIALMAAQEVPAAMADVQHQGSLLTLFLYNPTVAFLYICNLDEVSELSITRYLYHTWDLFVRKKVWSCGPLPWVDNNSHWDGDDEYEPNRCSVHTDGTPQSAGVFSGTWTSISCNQTMTLFSRCKGIAMSCNLIISHNNITISLRVLLDYPIRLLFALWLGNHCSIGLHNPIHWKNYWENG